MDYQQREDLHAKIWRIADEVRGAVDCWDFKQFVLGTLFYRFISESFAKYMDEEVKAGTYERMEDDDDRITEKLKQACIDHKGYFIYPSQLFKKMFLNAVVGWGGGGFECTFR